jgi:3-phosphoshikimate 1-carboxyvinyltransferase
VVKKLDYTNTQSINASVVITGSKSESNRLLILQKQHPYFSIDNLSNSDDTNVLIKALTSKTNKINIGHTGTAMRFLTAYFASIPDKTTVLTGSERMQERPIKILVDVLQKLGVKISYLNKEGFPPIEIKGKKIIKNQVSINADVSSQYITALLLIAPFLPKGLQLTLKGEITSTPYIKMTLSLLKKIGVTYSFIDKIIKIDKFHSFGLKPKTIHVEPDWSSASYFYSLAALQINTKIKLPGFRKDSIQGDRILSKLYKKLGVQTTYTSEGIYLKSTKNVKIKHLDELDFSDSPDLAQTYVVTCFGLGIDCKITGLKTLKIKETDRLQALKNELQKLGASVRITQDSIELKNEGKINKNIKINTYKDHRMAMAFAVLSVKTPLIIKNPEVVSKSYPDFWKDLERIFRVR